MRDLFNHIHPVRAISPVAAVADNTPFVSEVVDTFGYNGLVFVIATGSLADADATFAVLVEHDDASGFGTAAAVPDELLNGTETLAGFTFADDNETRKIGYCGDKRYVRLTITPSANAGNAFITAIAILGFPHIAPPPNPPV